VGPYRCEFLVKYGFYPFIFDPPPHPPTPSLLSVEQKKTGIRTGFTELAKSLAYCVQKLSRLGFNARGTPRRIKQKRVNNSKARFHEKVGRFVETKEGCKKLLAKNRGCFSTRKSHANDLTKAQARVGTLFVFS
jgi:hypothetical protein